MKKKILVAISGGIAVYKVAQLVSNLSKKYEIQVIMTKHARAFMSPLTFEALTGRAVPKAMFTPDVHYDQISHIHLAKWADIIIIAPATANLIAKMAHGLADDLLSTTMLATRSPILLCPAMNTNMLNHQATVANLELLQNRGIHILESERGLLACGDFGSGKLPEVSIIQETAEKLLEINQKQDLTGLEITVTAGPTQEALDPVRFITNHSSGIMGYSIAEAAQARGATVNLISGPTNITAPPGVSLIKVISARDMFDAVQSVFSETDILIKAAAVADYRPTETFRNKIKKQEGDLQVKFVRNPDILAWAGEHKQAHQVLCGFAMETEDLLDNAKAKLQKKNCDMLVANSLRDEGAGFGATTNVATLLWPNQEPKALTLMSKKDLSELILDELLKIKKVK
ncbi:MAG TPA: bifunctional phosphopantothenoylcysteine decarboxylase/phosphopantothenate--cysteine ligase CoaBC [Clostridiaceae bacterium]|nr:bifunctional phosphopantothenoylcysteine decarboxylase/phosphopantothenate--cysteine ligase CoaBC [Clostridiaceae bacterium]